MADDLETVVGRLRARGPSNQSGVKCWFCQRIAPWWECDCVGATEAKTGKRPKPRVVFRDGVQVIVLDKETVQANVRLGRRRYKPRVHTKSSCGSEIVHAAPDSVHAEDSSVHKDGLVDSEIVHTTRCPVHTPNQSVHKAASVDSEDKGAARKAYKAEWMRRQRQKPQ